MNESENNASEAELLDSLRQHIKERKGGNSEAKAKEVANAEEPKSAVQIEDRKTECEEERKLRNREKRKRREADLEERKSITKAVVRAKMRKSRRNWTPLPDESLSYELFSEAPSLEDPRPLPDFVHTYQSAELELKRRGYIKIRRNWLSVSSEEIDSFRDEKLAGGITVSCAKILDLGEYYVLPEGETSVDLKVWCSLKYFNGIGDTLFFVRPEEEEFEEWLPDVDFDSVISNSFTDAGSPSPIRSLCNRLRIAEPSYVNDTFSSSPIAACLKNLDDLGSLRSTCTRNLIGLLEDLGLFDYDLYYEDNAIDLYYDPKRKDCADDPLGFLQDTFKQSRELIVSHDPRAFWLELGQVDNDEIDFLRHRVARLASVAYDAGYEACREEILDEHGKVLMEGHAHIQGRPKKGETLEEHTRMFREATAAYQKETEKNPTPAKVRDFINASGNDNWIKTLNEKGFNSLSGVVDRL